MTKRDLLALEDWSPADVETVLKLARRIKQGELSGGLERRILGLVLLRPEPHIRLSLETAMSLHGGQAVEAEAEQHIVDTARVLGRMPMPLPCAPSKPVEAGLRPGRILCSIASPAIVPSR